MTIKAKKSKINLREKLAELLNFRQIRDRLDGLGLYLGKDRTGTTENVAVRGGASIDDLQLAEISAALGGTAVDVFVYDTRNDSDGGKWRERTSHTSWYNEPLNTSTRGGRREFPAVAVIVAEAGKVTIYDGDDPDLSMWMVFEGTYLGIEVVNILTSDDTHPLSSVFALQGILCIGVSALNGFEYINFVDDSAGYYRPSISGVYNGGILERNDGKGKTINSGSFLVDGTVNDVAMTVLPNAPIDAETGLPVPTIAVATDAGVSVIRDDGGVVDITSSSGSSVSVSKSINFTHDNRLSFNMFSSGLEGRYFHFTDIPSADQNIAMTFTSDGTIFNKLYILTPEAQPINTITPKGLGVAFSRESEILSDSRNVFGSDEGLTLLDYNKNITPSVSEAAEGMVCYATSSYNTGWMPGDIKLATLSDTKIEKVGVDETTELVTNGTFDSDYTGWTGEDANLSNANHPDSGSDSLLVTPTASLGKAIQNVTTVSEKKYVLSADIAFGAGCTKITIADNSGAVINEDYLVAGGNRTVAIDFDGNASMSNLQLLAYGGPAYFDNISIKQTGELITNGTFDDGTTGWTDASSNWSAASGQASSSGTGSLTQVITTIVGETYTISIDAVTIVSPYVRVVVGSAVPVQLDVGYTGTKAGTFTATSTSTTIQINPYASGQTIDNISVRLAEDDRSVNENGLQIFGEIDKTPVAPGADLVAYSGFSADNYLMQPYNSDLNFGTGDFCVMGWVNQPAGQTSYLIDRRSGGNHGIAISINTSNLLYVSIRNGTADVLGGVNFPTGSWAFMCFVRRDGIGYIYINGSLLLQGNLDDDASETAPLAFGGISYLNTGSCEASLALFRISATVPTDDQIAKIYRDEKVLFQDGAQATLYGTSDAVTALAYDDKTELLHVGTSSGRSDFAGLRRINNTTTAVTTSISASNNLIAEQ